MSKRRLIAFLLIAVAWLQMPAFGVGDGGASEWSIPPKEQLAEVVKAPEKIRPLVESVTVNQAAAIMIAVVELMQDMEMSDADIAATLNAMLNHTTMVRGEAFGHRVLLIIRKKVNKRLLPPVPPGAIPPGSGSRYPRQSAP